MKHILPSSIEDARCQRKRFLMLSMYKDASIIIIDDEIKKIKRNRTSITRKTKIRKQIYYLITTHDEYLINVFTYRIWNSCEK